MVDLSKAPPQDNLAERCREILDWSETGVLKANGALRIFAAEHIPKEIEDSWARVRLAESETAREAMLFTANTLAVRAVDGMPAAIEALEEARSGLCAFTGGPDGACGETVRKIDAALAALKGA